MKKTLIHLYVIVTLLLSVRNGRLALICRETNAVCRTYPLSAAMLPPSDQQALTAGIEIRNERHLLQLLEDYLS